MISETQLRFFEKSSSFTIMQYYRLGGFVTFVLGLICVAFLEKLSFNTFGFFAPEVLKRFLLIKKDITVIQKELFFKVQESMMCEVQCSVLAQKIHAQIIDMIFSQLDLKMILDFYSPTPVEPFALPCSEKKIAAPSPDCP